MRNAAAAGGFAIVAGLVSGAFTTAVGAAIGCALGLFSIWSLAVAIPRLCSNPEPIAKFGLAMLLIAKLPLYAGVLMFAMTSHYVNAFAVFAGVAMVPVAIIWDGLSHAASEGGFGRQVRQGR